MMKTKLLCWTTIAVCIACILHVMAAKSETEAQQLSQQQKRNIFYVLMLANDKAVFEAELQFPTSVNGKIQDNYKERKSFLETAKNRYQKKVADIFAISHEQAQQIIAEGYESDKQWWRD